MSRTSNLGQEDYERFRRRIRLIAEQFLTSQIGFIEAARGLAPYWEHPDDEGADVYWDNLGPDMEPPLRSFVGVASETDDVPIGEIRDLWWPDALETIDRKVAKYESQVKGGAEKSAQHLIELTKQYSIS
jgi:hypothetical protein